MLVSGLASAPIRFSLGAQVGYTTYKVFEIGDGQLFHGNATVECLMGNSSYMAPEPCGKCKVTPVYCKVGKSPQYFMLSDGVLYDQRGAIGEMLLTTSFSLICRRSPVRCSIRDGRLFRRMVSGCLHSMAARGSGTVRRALTGCTSCMMRRLAVSVRQCILWCCSRCGNFRY